MGKMFRVTRAFKYSFLLMASIAGVVLVPGISAAGIPIPVAVAWTIFLFIGSSLALWGTIKKNWTGEYIGLPLIISCLVLLAWASFIGPLTAAQVFLGLIFLGFSFSTSARRSDVKFQKRLADYESRRKKGLVGL
jgi:hypothetical protein